MMFFSNKLERRCIPEFNILQMCINLAAYQCGFTEKHSTNLALLEMVDQVSTELANKQYIRLRILKPSTFWAIKF